MDRKITRTGSRKTLDEKIELLSETVMGSLMEETADILLSLSDSIIKNRSIGSNRTKHMEERRFTDHEETGFYNRT